MTAPLLDIRAASKALGGSPILNGVDLTLGIGEIAAVLGPSGAGKSTLLKVVAGLIRLDRGQLTSLAQNWDAGAEFIKTQQRGVGFVFQDYALFPHLTVQQNIAFGLKGLMNGDEIATRIAGLMKTVEIGHLARSFPHELSGGEKQRVALARALAPRPKIVLLDEPFSSLDRRLRSDLRAHTIAAIREAGAAALMVTHDADEAFELADRLFLMEDGRIVQSGAPAEVYQTPQSRTCAQLLGDVTVFNGTVSNGEIASPLGAVRTALPDGSDAVLLARPEAVIESQKGAELRVADVRIRQGRFRITAIAADGSTWLTDLPLTHGKKTGETIRLALDEAALSVVSR
ncbi:ABC transporter ATP-binding protein [Hyphobacterium sp.]|uniref:ABC transporter ATP-binding protein n=1 Tax=Hyphobacterium sp. TaxID=2004662 RepID=UPI003BAC1EF1